MRQLSKAVIIGVGLIGASIGAALKEKHRHIKVLGIGRTSANLDKALEKGAIDSVIPFSAEYLRDADVIVIATPIRKTAEYLKRLKDENIDKPIIMDVASSKNVVLSSAPENFVSVHPMAGSEKQGAINARADLFKNQPLIIIKDKVKPENIEFVKRFWEGLGSRIFEMTLEQHNRIVGLVSHLPHLLSYCVGSLLPDDEFNLIADIAGPGFFSFTRLGRSDARLWAEIFEDNSFELNNSADKVIAFLKNMKSKEDLSTILQSAQDKLKKVYEISENK